MGRHGSKPASFTAGTNSDSRTWDQCSESPYSFACTFVVLTGIAMKHVFLESPMAAG